jgi:peptidoglycan/xylan/chitin deacetylase (PgdA/CDA1 family)
MSKRELAQVLDATGVLEAILRARSRGGTPWLTTLTYHRIHDNPDGQPFDTGVIDATPDEFSRQMAIVRRYFSPIGVRELRGFMRGCALPPNPVIVTFDDGYRECHERALPILLANSVKATFFIATSYVSGRRVFWWDRIAYILHRTERDRIELTYPIPLQLDCRKTSKLQTGKTLLKLVKSQYGLDLERFLEELASAAGVEWNDELERSIADQLVMSWKQVRDLRAAGMEIHSHTRTHRILQTIRPDELSSELAGAREDLENQLEERVSGVSYPVGRSISASPALRAAVRDSGYEVGFSNGSGVSSLRGKFDPLDMRRISVERGLPQSYFRALLAIPSFAETREGRRP